MLDLLKKIEALDGGKELAAEMREKLTAQSGDLDTARAEAAKVAKALKAAETARDKAIADAETAKGSTDEQVKAHQAAAEAAAAALERAQGEHKAYKIQQAIAGKLEITGDKAAERKAAALKLGDWSGVDLDDKGELVGVDAPLKALQDQHSYIFSAPAPAAQGNGGAPAGSQLRAAPSVQQGTDDQDYAAGRAAAMAHLGHPAPKAQA